MLSTSLAVDLYKTFFNPESPQQKLLWVSRLASIGAGVRGILLASGSSFDYSRRSQIFYGLIAVVLFVPVVAGLYSRRVLVTGGAEQHLCCADRSDCYVTIRLTRSAGVGVLSPQAIGIAAAAVVMIGFRMFAPAAPANEGLCQSVQGSYVIVDISI